MLSGKKHERLDNKCCVMQKRFVSLWFRHLVADWFVIRRPGLRAVPFVLSASERGRKLITVANTVAQKQGISAGMVVADAKALVSSLEVIDDRPGLAEKLLQGIGEWCIRYTPVTAIGLPDGLLLDVTGCAHLWGGEKEYLADLLRQLTNKGYDARGAMADTIGAAWAIARFGKTEPVIESGRTIDALLPLPPSALRLENATVERLHKLGLVTVKHFISLPRSILRRRFGENMLDRIDEALGFKNEMLQPLQTPALYEERLPCLEPIITRTGIDIALNRLLEALCKRLQQENKGLRTAVFKGYRVDGQITQVTIGTNHASNHTEHLYKLFGIHLSTIEPALGIELFTLNATKVEEVSPVQEMLWAGSQGLNSKTVVELLDRIGGKIGAHRIRRYIPDEHYWPERSLKPAVSLKEKPTTGWQVNKPRPVQLLASPERIEVTAPVPDYPPMNFRYKGKLHTIKKADGPERIEREWWLDEGRHRDYYYVEDEEGKRYWLFRSGHYIGTQSNQWYLHGFFA
jgi:protein ImuB